MTSADLGLATERTALAWRRTAIGSMMVALLFLHHTAVSGWRTAGIAPIAAAATMIAMATLCLLRNRGLRRRRHDRGGVAVALTAAAVVTVACLAVVVEFADPNL